VEIESLVTALQRIDHAARDFLRLSDMPGAPRALHEALSRWSSDLDQGGSLDPAFDRQREAVKQACISARDALEILAVEVGPVPHAVVRLVRELSEMIGAILPVLVREADRG
jgi:hypothetical protein